MQIQVGPWEGGLGGEPGQSERLCEVFTWCRSASHTAGEAGCRKGTGACLSVHTPQGNGCAVYGNFGGPTSWLNTQF